MPRRITKEDYIALAQERNFTWLGVEIPQQSSIKTKWACETGHRWEASYHNIKRNGSGCPHCSGKAPKSPKDFHALARKRKFIWLGPEVATTAEKTEWRCPNNHTWFAHFGAIRSGKGCPVCAGKAPKTEQHYLEIAEIRGFVWLGPMVLNGKEKTGWKCSQGHFWQASYNSVSRGSGCPVCAGNLPKTEEDYHALAAQQGLVWLGPMVNNVLTRTAWLCENQHEWWSRYNDIKYGRRCPICRQNNS